MSEEIVLGMERLVVEVSDRIDRVQFAPKTVDPETGKEIEVVGMELQYRWYDKWVFLAAKVWGYALAEDYFCVETQMTTCDFYDPLGGEEGGAPQWVVAVANRRMAELRAPAPLKEQGNG